MEGLVTTLNNQCPRTFGTRGIDLHHSQGVRAPRYGVIDQSERPQIHKNPVKIPSQPSTERDPETTGWLELSLAQMTVQRGQGDT